MTVLLELLKQWRTNLIICYVTLFIFYLRRDALWNCNHFFCLPNETSSVWLLQSM